jgi:hypothetical protein
VAGAMSLDLDSGDLYVANDMGQSIIVFFTGKTRATERRRYFFT